jgi:hypothetical protein
MDKIYVIRKKRFREEETPADHSTSDSDHASEAPQPSPPKVP